MGTTTIAISTRLARLLQLASPTLPVGAYSYSGGLEAAIEAGVVSDARSAESWIREVLELSVLRMELPVLLRMIRGDAAAWNTRLLASRETSELRAETVQMGYSLIRLLEELGVARAELEETSYPAAFSFAVKSWRIEPREALLAYAWAWIENQVMAAVKAVPLGQTDGQRILLALGSDLPAFVDKSLSMEDHEMANFAPGLAILSSRHETQYSRLFRS